jgi:DNA replication and repair protein RecF
VRVERLILTGFRSYPELSVTFPSGPQLLHGPNAAGKTSLLEALVVLGTGRSHRASADTELVEWGGTFARLEALAESSGRHPERLEVVIARAGSGARKQVKVNGVPRRAAALPLALRVAIFAPEEMELVSGSPALRRASVDGLLAQRSAVLARALSDYARALQQRNTLLRSIREGLSSRDELGYWDRTVIDEGGRIVAARLELLDELAPTLVAAHAEVAPGEPPLALRYVTNAPTVGEETPRDAIARRLAETTEKELWNGATLIGPHRDDLVFEQDGRDLAAFGSRGQQRTAILAFKLAQVDALTRVDGRPPLLLLDDVFSELDPDRRAALVRRIRDLPQSFVTTTSLGDLDPALVAASTSWRVRPGSVEADPR